MQRTTCLALILSASLSTFSAANEIVFYNPGFAAPVMVAPVTVAPIDPGFAQTTCYLPPAPIFLPPAVAVDPCQPACVPCPVACPPACIPQQPPAQPNPTPPPNGNPGGGQGSETPPPKLNPGESPSDESADRGAILVDPENLSTQRRATVRSQVVHRMPSVARGFALRPIAPLVPVKR